MGRTGRARKLMSLSIRDPKDRWWATIDRAYWLAETGRFANLEAIKSELRQEGHKAVLTALRSTLVRRELRALCHRGAF